MLGTPGAHEGRGAGRYDDRYWVVSVIAYELRRILGDAATILGRENGWGWDAGGSYRLELPQ